MPSYEAMRDRLPLLYRPEDDDASGEPLPLAPADVVEIACEPARAPALSMANGLVVAALDAPARVRSIRIAPGRAPGTGCALEIYRLEGSTAHARPAVSAAVRGGVATLSVPFEDARFGLRLRRPGLLAMLLRAVAGEADEAGAEAQRVLQAHWYGYADRADLDPYFFRARALGLVDALPDDSPWVRDLARLGALVAPPPWTEPVAERETVEEYRERISDVVTLYREGLGTLHALRMVTEAQLPTERERPPEERDRGFTVEEPAAAESVLRQASTLGGPEGVVGPLMRWRVESDGVEPAHPTLYVQGTAPEGERTAATERPLVELYAAGNDLPRLGLAYGGTLAPDETLRLRPAYLSWLGQEDGVRRAESRPAGEVPADPTAPGPWRLVPAPPEGPPRAAVTALWQAHDRTLWAAFRAEGGTELWRGDGRTWAAALTGLPEVHALEGDGPDLLVGTERGLLRVALHPPEGEALAAAPVAAAGEGAVHALLHTSDGRLLLGTARGVLDLGADGAAPFLLHPDLGTEVPVYALAEDRMGVLLLGTELGVFQHHPGSGETYWYAGGEPSETRPEWEPLAPGTLPAEEEVFLPPVRCVHRGRDSSLWLGTTAGIARYVARAARGLAYTTLLEAFPDLVAKEVYAIREDERGGVWLCTERGLFRFDGRDWWQHGGAGWAQLGRAGLRYEGSTPGERPRYRYLRGSARWQTWDTGTGWLDAGDPLRSARRPAVRALLWTDHVAAEVGAWDGSRFTPAREADAALLRMRHKPVPERAVDGGIPAVPRLPPGGSTWRYLSLEGDEPLPALRPAWTREGRLLPPAAPDAPPGRFDVEGPPPAGKFDEAAFAYPPAARVWMGWEPRRPSAVLVRLRRRSAEESIDPAVLDRVWQGIRQVRPAGVRTLLAVEETIVRGKKDAADR